MANLGSIHTYRAELDRIIRLGGSTKETAIRRAVSNLISGPTVAEKFNTYHFADYMEKVIDLLHFVFTVSVETMKIVRAMPAL